MIFRFNSFEESSITHHRLLLRYLFDGFGIEVASLKHRFDHLFLREYDHRRLRCRLYYNNLMFTFFDGSPKDRTMAHVAWDGKSIDRGYIVDIFWLLLILFP
jgi:hypothetical protein